MMTQKIRFSRSRALLSALALTLVAAFTAPQSAQASTGANSLIANTVTVNFENASGVAQAAVTATATVTVDLVVTTPILSQPDDQSTDFGVAATYSYTLTSSANGLATYNLSEAITAENNINGSTTALSVPSLDLGATTLAANTVAGTVITVPYDGSDNGNINGIEAGDTIVIDGVVYTVAGGGIDEDPTTNLSTITLTAAVPAGISAGEIVGERKAFTLTVTPANDPATQEGATITVLVTAQDSGTVAGATTDETITTVTNVPSATLTVTKEVSVDGGTSFAASANAVPGDTLLYRIIVTNSSLVANATNIVLTDPEPMFTTYDPDSAESSTSAAAYGDAGNTQLTDTDAGDDGFDFGVTTGGTATFSVGTLAPGASVYLYYQVIID